MLKDQELVKEQMFRISNKERITDSVFTFTFTQKKNSTVNNLKLWYNDLSMVGRHFLVSSKRFPKIKRHYTICSCMRPEILKALINLELDVLNGKSLTFDMNLLDSKDQDKICLSLKNYKMPKGVSTQIHGVVPVLDAPQDEHLEMNMIKEGNTSRELENSVELCSPVKGREKDCNDMHTQSPRIYLPSEAAVMAQTVNAVNTETGFNSGNEPGNVLTGQMRPIEEMFNIKGPMGRGLEITKSGLHIAFCAGTGVLVFLDLVAHLLLRNVCLAK